MNEFVHTRVFQSYYIQTVSTMISGIRYTIGPRPIGPVW